MMIMMMMMMKMILIKSKSHQIQTLHLFEMSLPRKRNPYHDFLRPRPRSQLCARTFLMENSLDPLQKRKFTLELGHIQLTM